MSAQFLKCQEVACKFNTIYVWFVLKDKVKEKKPNKEKYKI